MAFVKYLGRADSRTINAADFKANGLEGQTQVVFSDKNSFTAEVSDEAAALLTKLEPTTFKTVESEKEGQQTLSAAEEIESSKTASAQVSDTEPAKK